MTPTLLEAAKAVATWIRTKVDPSGPTLKGLLRDLEAAIAAEEAKPKVERVVVWRYHDGRFVDCKPNPNWLYEEGTVCAIERPIPAKTKREELAERLEESAKGLVEPAYPLGTLLREAAAMLREGKE